MNIFQTALAALALFPAHAAAPQEADSLLAWDGQRPVKVYHVYSGADGTSHVEVIDMQLILGRDGGKRILSQAVTSAHLGTSSPKELSDWHYAVNQHFILSLVGNLRFDTGDGKEYLLKPGQAVLAEDWTGKGHRSGCDPRNKVNCVAIDLELGPIAKTYPLRTPPAN